jgi:hypothetical protein
MKTERHSFDRRCLSRLVVSLGLLIGALVGNSTGVAAQQQLPAAIVAAVDVSGAPVPGACFVAVQTDQANPQFRFGGVFTYCDRDDGTEDGSTSITSIYQPGTYEVYQVTAAAGYQVGSRSSFDYTQGATAQLSVTQTKGGETLTITALDASGAGITEGCFYLARDNGVGLLGQPIGRGCVPDGATDGIVTIGGLPAGDFILQNAFTQTLRPKEYRMPVSIRSGKDAEVAVAYAPATTGSIAVQVVDDSGAPVLGNVCLTATQTDGDKTGFGSTCDQYDNSTPGSYDPDGTVLLTGLPDGKYEILPNPTPAGYRIAKNPAHATVAGSAMAKATFKLKAGGQSLTIVTQRSDPTASITGGCFSIYEATGHFTLDDWYFFGCQNGQSADGSLTLSLSVPEGNLVIAQSGGTPGQAPMPDKTVTVGKGEQVSVTVETVPAGVIRVAFLDAAGKSVRNGCVEAIGEIDEYQGGRAHPLGEPAPAACDIDDGVADGAITILSLPAGKYRIVPVTPPHGFLLPASASVNVKSGRTATVKLTTAKGGGLLNVAIADASPSPATRGYCVAVFAAQNGKPGERITQRCDSFDGTPGEIAIAGLASGSYLIGLDANGSIVDPPDVPLVAATVTADKTANATIAIPKEAG